MQCKRCLAHRKFEEKNFPERKSSENLLPYFQAAFDQDSHDTVSGYPYKYYLQKTKKQKQKVGTTCTCTWYLDLKFSTLDYGTKFPRYTGSRSCAREY